MWHVGVAANFGSTCTRAHMCYSSKLEPRFLKIFGSGKELYNNISFTKSYNPKPKCFLHRPPLNGPVKRLLSRATSWTRPGNTVKATAVTTILQIRPFLLLHDLALVILLLLLIAILSAIALFNFLLFRHGTCSTKMIVNFFLPLLVFLQALFLSNMILILVAVATLRPRRRPPRPRPRPPEILLTDLFPRRSPFFLMVTPRPRRRPPMIPTMTKTSSCHGKKPSPS